MDAKSELLVVTAGNNSQAVPWEDIQGARLIKRRVRFGFGPPDTQAKTEQIILAK